MMYLFLSCLYLLTAAGRLGNSDAGSMYAATRSLYTHRWIDVGPCRAETNGNQCVPGVDGRMYSGYGLVPSVVTYPSFALGWQAAKLLHKNATVITGMTVSFTNVFLTPLISLVMCIWLVQLGYPLKTSVFTALVLGLATPIWFHGVKGFFSEPQFTLAFLLCCYMLFRSEQKRNAWLGGLCFGIACGTRIYGLILCPVLVWYLWKKSAEAGISPSSARANVLGFLLMLSICLACIGAVNYARFGSVLKTGYQLAFPTIGALLSTPFWHGLSSVLFNGEVGLLWYMPLVVLFPLAWKSFLKRNPNEAWLCLGVCVISIVFYAKYTAWHGGWSYGPRLLVPTLPFLVMPLVVLLDEKHDRNDYRSRLYCLGLVAVSLLIQVLGLTSSTARYYNLQRYYRAVGSTPWWGDSPLLQDVAALPQLAEYQPDPDLPKSAQSGVTGDAADPPPQQFSSPSRYLDHFQNSINLKTFDIWLVKAAVLGLPRKFVLLTIAILLAGAVSSLTSLVRLTRVYGRDQRLALAQHLP